MDIKPLPTLLLDHPVPTWSYDKKTQEIKGLNKSALKVFGYSTRDTLKFRISDLVRSRENDPVQKSHFSGSVVSKSGERFRVKGSFKVLKDKTKKYDLMLIHQAIKEESGKEEPEVQHATLDKIVHVSHNEIYLVSDKTLNFEYANTAALKNLGYTPKEIKSLKLTDLFSFPDEMGINALLNSLRKAETDRLQLQLRYRRKNGSHYDAEALIQVLEKGKLFLLIVTDITAKLITERKLLDTIREKEALIKEIHHRVKNNLQLISSIIYLKIASISQSDIRGFLEDTRQKIRSIALIHERLLQTEKIDKVEISDYLGKLIHDLRITYYRQDLQLDIDTQIDEVMINLDTAIICGLIVNELITNAIKHAFTGRAEGSIAIRFKQQDSKYELSVADDGVTLPAHITPGSSSSFGMQLIDVFVKQLGGNYEIIRDSGTKFRIHF